MTALLHDLLAQTAKQSAERIALRHHDICVSYRELLAQAQTIAAALQAQGLHSNERVAIYLPKQIETIVSLFACSFAGAVFVPINPALKPAQVQHILQDCAVSILITSAARAQQLQTHLNECHALRTIIVSDDNDKQHVSWSQLALHTEPLQPVSRIDQDIAAILYTSGSTGKPKGVVLSHRNLLAGAESVTSYLGNSPSDRILAVLPLSFDYGLSQITTAFRVGACVCLLEYLLPNDVIKACARYQITGLAAVPPLWMQLAAMTWPEEAKQHLRYWTNSGGHMPRTTLDKLRTQLPNTTPYLMYGLTEAFRSTYLPPEELDRRPDSIGKAIPNAEIVVLRADGSECGAEEVGELVHRGVLVSLGYWNDADKTAERFKILPAKPGLMLPEIAVFSGDKVRKDADGFLYFVGRDDELIKSSAYRISPTEVEEAFLSSALVAEVVVFGAKHPQLGQAIVALYTSHNEAAEPELRAHLQKQLPAFMLPQAIIKLDQIPRNANGKMDRALLRQQYATLFGESI